VKSGNNNHESESLVEVVDQAAASINIYHCRHVTFDMILSSHRNYRREEQPDVLGQACRVRVA
jgi:hypothetical protein